MKTTWLLFWITLSYIAGCGVVITLVTLVSAIIGVFGFGLIGLVAGIFNGTGTEFIYLTASDGAKLVVSAYLIYSVGVSFFQFPEVVTKYFDQPEVRRYLRG